jgi:hypothetical protein
MIRRELITAGTAERWVLISQVDHARLAFQLAEHWGADGFAPLEPRAELLWTIEHHDDGWRDWEQTPDVDPHSGRPLAFTEMSVRDALAIWTGSIEVAERAGSLEAFLVAGHFCALASRSAAWRSHEPGWPDVESFLACYRARQVDWLAAWQAQHPAGNTWQVAEKALTMLQLFDLFSLWFCCAPATEPDQVEIPGGPILAFRPLDETHVVVSPWPFSAKSVNLEVPGRAVPVRRYISRDHLAAAPAQPVLLRWQLLQQLAKS